MKDKFMKNGVFSLEYDKETLRDMVLELQEENQQLKDKLSKIETLIINHNYDTGDIYYKYAYKLTYENWKKRLARLPNQEPQFIITEHTGYGYTEKVLQRLAKITKYKLLILTNKNIIGNEYTIVIKISDYQITHYNNGRTQYILNEAKPKLKNWLIP